MKINTLPLLLLLLFFQFTIGQSDQERFVMPTLSERNMQQYEKDTTANAVVLYEKGENFVDVVKNRVRLVKKYYTRVKIFNREAFDKATIKIPIYKGKEVREHVTNIKAITHNGGRQVHLSDSKVFTEDINERWSQVVFTMPDIKEGSIIEYEYTLESPYFFNFNGWEFQSDIPKVYSEFHAKIPANYRYNRILIGYLNLDVNDSSVKKSCFHPEGLIRAADCEVLTYAMKDIPAFVEEEFMTARSNYLSSIKFELSEYMSFSGEKTVYTKTWKAVDREFKNDKEIGRQLRKAKFFENKLPSDIFQIENSLERAKAVYKHIKGHYTWNGKYSIFTNTNVKQAYDSKTGSVADINLSLINALLAADIKTEMIALSTRRNGLPTKLHPVISDFNYIIGKATIDGREYLVDATDPLLPFGMVPFRCLNSYGRAMDFKNESYWHDIHAKGTSAKNVYAQFNIGEDFSLTGNVNQLNTGYNAKRKRAALRKGDEDDYLGQLEDSYDNLEIESYENGNLENLDKPLKEVFKVLIEPDGTIDKLYFSPFLFTAFETNPFKLEERKYAVNFGYRKSYSYQCTLFIDESLEVVSLPKNEAYGLPDNGGSVKFLVQQTGNKITLNYKFSLLKSQYGPSEYAGLKEVFGHVSRIQTKLPIVIKKKDK